MLFWGAAGLGFVLLVWQVREDRRVDRRLFWAVGFGPWTARVASAVSGVLLFVGMLLGIFAYLMFSVTEETLRWRHVVTTTYLNVLVLAVILMAYACVYSKSKQR